jgi:hypothetical protein
MADHGFSERRACRLIGVNRSAWQYEPLRGQDDAMRERMREIANERRRFGYRRLAIMLKLVFAIPASRVLHVEFLYGHGGTAPFAHPRYPQLYPQKQPTCRVPGGRTGPSRDTTVRRN